MRYMYHNYTQHVKSQFTNVYSSYPDQDVMREFKGFSSDNKKEL